MKYITKNSTWKDVFEAYREAKAEILRIKRLHENAKEKKAKVIKHKNEKYEKLSYKLFKSKQKVYGKEKHIGYLRSHINSKVAKAKKEGYQKGLQQVKERDGRIIDMYTFLAKINTVSSILGMSLVECSFLLWAGTYNFYSSNDFRRDCNELGFSFYSINNKMVKRGFVVPLENRDSRIKMFSLSGTGISMFEKIDKFTKKQFE